MYSLADNDCDAGKWCPLPPGRPRVDCVTDESEARGFDNSCPLDVVDDDVEDGVNDDVIYDEFQSFCKKFTSWFTKNLF